MHDTDPNAVASCYRLIDAASGAERLAQAARLSDAVRTLAIAGLRRRHPVAGNAEIEWRPFALCYGQRIAEQALGTSPERGVDDLLNRAQQELGET